MKTLRWLVLALLVVAAVVVARKAVAEVGEPEVEVNCSIDTREGRATVTCNTSSSTHRCQVRELGMETGPSIPGNGVRSKLELFCPGRLSTAMLDTELIRAYPEGCRWTVPVQGLGRVAFACVGSPGSRQRKLERFTVPS